jgi:hypothetical protein
MTCDVDPLDGICDALPGKLARPCATADRAELATTILPQHYSRVRRCVHSDGRRRQGERQRDAENLESAHDQIPL